MELSRLKRNNNLLKNAYIFISIEKKIQILHLVLNQIFKKRLKLALIFLRKRKNKKIFSHIKRISQFERNICDKLDKFDKLFSSKIREEKKFPTETSLYIEEEEENFLKKFLSKRRKNLSYKSKKENFSFNNAISNEILNFRDKIDINNHKILHNKYFETNFNDEFKLEDCEKVKLLALGKRKRLHKRPKFLKIEISIDIIDLPKSIKINGSNACYVDKKQNKKHVNFVFTNLKLEQNYVEWSIEIKKLVKWIGFGICMKDNFYCSHKFTTEERVSLNVSNHCCLSITTGGIIWNFIDESLNNYRIPDFPDKIRENDIFKFRYSINSLMIAYKSFSFRIHIPKENRYPVTNFVPFSVLNPGCEISFI